ncbi:tRNA (adenosine(37)-N6)-dimethylallyltransferase MiaA [Lachnospiraceae bacterium oral taxon 500]|nr:tRNA (adenosine(37)-N6)-dimethylallyltransferase MiaA [Lachnospiraceae bacterium oral taxon 500]
MAKQPLIIIAGPTATGKTKLAVMLAKQLNGSIISADSMQVYRGMDIGSAKASAEEQAAVKHYLLDIREPEESFSVWEFQKAAKEAIAEITAAGKIPILVGGTGFYIQALLYDIAFEESGPTQVREKWEEIAADRGYEYLYEELKRIDPESTSKIHANNHKRILRALEYYDLTGEKISLHNQRESQKESSYQELFYVLTMDRAMLYQRIEQRVDAMLAGGLIEEVQKLYDRGCRREMTAMQGLGYKEILNYLSGEWSLEKAAEELKKGTRHFAKRQITWFKREKNVEWIDLNNYTFDYQQICDKIKRDYAVINR